MAEVTVQIRPVNIVRLAVKIVGTAPYVQHKFSKKAQLKMMADQRAGSMAKGKKVRTPREFEKDFENAKHVSSDGWCGIPASCFRNAMISACRTVGFKMTHAKLAVFVEGDGVDDEGTALVKIHGTPVMHIAPARNDNGSMDIRARPMWREGWWASVRIRFDGDMFSAADVVNLMQRCGAQVGIGEGRPDSRNSPGMGWGTFDCVTGAEAADGD